VRAPPPGDARASCAKNAVRQAEKRRAISARPSREGRIWFLLLRASRPRQGHATAVRAQAAARRTNRSSSPQASATEKWASREVAR